MRQFGGAFVLGYQVFAQLEDIYGEKGAQSIAGTLNNRIVFNTPDARTAKMFSESLGFEDILEQRENLSFGAHESRDGVSFVTQRVERPIVTASEIQALPQFEAYIRFAYDAPTAQVTFAPVDITPRAEKFVKYHGGGFDMDGMDPRKGPPSPAPAASRAAHFAPGLASKVQQERRRLFQNWRPADQLAAFDAWLEEGKRPIYNPATGAMDSPLGDAAPEVLWDHYYRQRVSGQEKPIYAVTPDLSAMVGSRGTGPREANQAPPPSLQVTRKWAETSEASSNVVPLHMPEEPPLPFPDVHPTRPAPKDGPSPDPLEEALEDKGTLL